MARTVTARTDAPVGMRAATCWLLGLTLYGIATFAAADIEDRLSADAVHDDLALAREALQRLHAGYDRYADPEEMERRWSALQARADDGMRFEPLYVGLSELLAALRCDHTKAQLPEERVAARDTVPAYLPFRFRLFGGPGQWRMFVEHSGSEVLQRGDEVLRIDGDPVAERIDAVWPLVPVDGNTTHVRALEIQASGEFLGSAFDHFDPLLNEPAPTVSLQVRDAQGTVRSVEAARVTYPAFRELTGQRSRWSSFSDPGAVQVDYPEEGIAVLRVSTFVNYRSPVDPAEVFDPVFRELRDRDVRRLVVDMRSTGGGSVDVQEALIARLIREPVRTVREIRVRSIDLEGLREHLRSWSQEAMDPQPEWFDRSGDDWVLNPEFGGAGGPIQPHPLAFDGELVVITGPGNRSGATTMIGAVRQAGGALLVGEPTGGNQGGSTAGILYFLTLPNSRITIRIPAQRAVTGFREVVDGEGYAPDIPRAMTLADWLAGRDPALATALRAEPGVP